ncbi:MAG: biosynthetic-type acetolactate synthase large subunit [Candidatus Ranarchaeia archaeon]
MRGAEAIVNALIESDTEYVFGFPGGAVIPIYDVFLEYQEQIHHILVRHEQGAAHAADAYARVSGKPGVCFATSGPGATNLVTGIMTAHMDSSPLIAFAGQVPTRLIGKDAFQETDMMGITMPITKHNFLLRDPNKARATIKRAFSIAMQGRPGPVYIDLPKDMQLSEVTIEDWHVGGGTPKMHPVPDPQSILEATKLILDSERPLFLLGGGVIWSNASQEVRQLVETVNAPVVTTVMGKGGFPDSHPLCLGTVGMHGRRAANYAFINSDLIITIGSRWSDRISSQPGVYEESHKLIHIDIDAAEISKNAPVNVPIIADAKRAARELTKAILKKGQKRPDSSWAKRMKQLAEFCDCSSEAEAAPPDSQIKMHTAMLKLNKIILPTDIVTTGVGQHQMFASHLLKRERPRTFITSGGAGTMGFGLPAAIGAKFAAPDSNVFDIDGDGSFNMTAQELATIKQHDIKVIPIIFNNGYLGMVRQWLELFMDKRYSEVSIGRNPDFVKLAQSYGLDGTVVSKVEEFEPAVRESIKADETFIIDCHVPEEENVLPMIPPGGNIENSFGGCMAGKGKFFSDEELKQCFGR